MDELTELNLPLNDYLKHLYPDADDATIQKYVKWIEDSESKKLPPTPEMREYLEMDAQEKKAKERKEELRDTIIKQRQRLGLKFQTLSITSGKRRTYDESKLYEWAAGFVEPDILEEMTVRTIDSAKFKIFESQGKIQFERFPDGCYTETPTWTLKRTKD
jgi:hypothetical protein